MPETRPSTPEAYLDALPPARREDLGVVRQTVLANLADGFREVIAYGMIAYVVPLERYPDTYNAQPLLYAALGSQKRHMALYLSAVYAMGGEAFRTAYLATGKRLDMGKSCVRFRRVDDLPLELVGRTIAAWTPDSFIALIEPYRRDRRRRG